MKSLRSSSNDSGKKSTPSKSQNGKDQPYPNMVLIMHLHNRSLDQDLCSALNKALKTETDFAESMVVIIGKFHIHKWTIPVPDTEKTKRAVAKFNQQHDDVALELSPTEQSVASQPWKVRVMDVLYAAMRLVTLTRFTDHVGK